ncbi:MAG: multifunctional oxoglutarate decarboxylase/oxoglutarate dehydrogenase thiamine pyrophosphate-binding subunit/dihydrolipoyllysine-residue succinyltransferase subunit [Acidimicrobiaceae bacterium]|nr:multifunctional oxoglutarate decarboxylase/oxoglutarate dehydrogenase thiamine pyrophosphate-binding subunit/dihydrolipoyllysine-residue succinyltransferase subunit [Acidimicrobiaceae bacterium]
MTDSIRTEPSDDLGANAWVVDEMRDLWAADPASVDEAWRALFEGETPDSPAGKAGPPAPAAASRTTIDTTATDVTAPGAPAESATPPPAAAAAPPRTPAAEAAPPDAGRQRRPRSPKAQPDGDDAPIGEPIKGVGARIVSNMEASLAVPTATSFREVPAKLLEVNRKIMNGHLGRKMVRKISFTHFIGYAVVRAITDTVPAMNNIYVTDAAGKPRIVRPDHIGLGIAVDIARDDGTRSLMVPCIRDADTLDFAGFVDRYDEQIAKIRENRLTADDMRGVTVTITNPGTIGTQQSVPRLMTGQGTIVGVGALAFPTEYEAADPSLLADLGVSKLVTISSTYDHRVIQGAESGLFLQRVHDLLLGADDFYDGAFRALHIPYSAVQWRRDFNPVDREAAMLEKQAKVNQLINQYRVRGHLIADLNPLRDEAPQMHAELDPATYGLTIWDLDREFLTGSETGIYATVGGTRRMKLGDLLGVLRDAYCRTVGVEYMHIQEPEEKRWIQEQIEGTDTTLSGADQRHILSQLNAAEALSSFLGTKYVGQKRFGLEGAESTIPLLDAVLTCAADEPLAEVVMGMAHRGRLNVLVNLVGKSYHELFKEFEGAITEDQIQGSGDVKYHLGQIGAYESPSGKHLLVEMAANPSHLEAVDPVVVGMARARMDNIPPDSTYGPYPVMPLLIHGDAAFAGQGVVAETFNLSLIRGYRVGGTIHLVIDNQLGFTTTPDAARSTQYSTDVAKMVGAPIFHVNGDDPEACVRAARLAFAYRQRFNKDVVIDMICYRRHGHNEGDDPSYTLPEMYRRINAKPTVRTQYRESLLKRGDISAEDADASLAEFRDQLQAALDETRDAAPGHNIRARRPPEPMGVMPHVRTAIDSVTVERIYEALNTVPEGFTVHPKLARQFEQRNKMFRSGEFDWGVGEAMAFGSLLMEGTPVRLSGQDSRRGTFSHRHSTLVDYVTGDEYVPLSTVCAREADLWIYDSLLSEYAALGFEYGYAVAKPEALVMWEAQFGDFANGAQIIIDQFLVAAEDKWDQHCGIVLLLPHGMEGQGPEHSSARIERFLTLAAEDNMHVCQPTTAGQYFHLLRRQMIHRVRKPMIVFTPKSLLRSKAARTKVDHLSSGTFEEVLGDPAAEAGTLDAEAVTRVVFCSGKVGYAAMELRDERNAPLAVCRVEQLFPWPYGAVDYELRRYPNATEIVWLQEEPENMGAWNGIKGRLYEAHGDDYEIRRVSRPESGSPAGGSPTVHAQEQQDLLEAAVLA